MILQNWWFTTLLNIQQDLLQPPLKSDISADVLIIGAGAAGLSAALTLMDKGLKVVLLERNICGGSSTGKSAGFLTPDSELELSQLLRRFGVQGARDLWEVATQGIELMLDTVKKYGLSCDLIKQDSLFLANGASGWKEVHEEFEARKKLGYLQTLYTAEELPTVISSVGYTGGVRYPGTYGINPLLYAQGVKSVLLQHGVQIYEASEARSIRGHTVKTHLGSVTADQIIVCVDKLKPQLSSFSNNVYHAQTFLSISEPLRSKEVEQIFPNHPFQCWDTDLVYTYYRLTGDQRLLVGGGSMLTTFSANDVPTPEIIERVIRRFKQKFPFLKSLEFIQYWPGRIDTTRDLLPTVTRDKEAPWVHYVLGCVGLPWATFCGNFAAQHVIDGPTCRCENHKYYQYFTANRNFFVPLWAERFLCKQLVFSINNSWAKYFQVDIQKRNSKVP